MPKTNRAAPDLPIVSGRQPGAAPTIRNTFAGLTSHDRAPHEEILHRAYAIWESEGHPDNRKLDHWLAAEAEVMGRGRV